MRINDVNIENNNKQKKKENMHLTSVHQMMSAFQNMQKLVNNKHLN